mmetsp:Transcript_55528/g.140467  ORF Transcript_55528/g.140467 Transcript_55528/m.140467 type:complete len:254 (+) Transcript_55528:1344-2105(+)
MVRASLLEVVPADPAEASLINAIPPSRKQATKLRKKLLTEVVKHLLRCWIDVLEARHECWLVLLLLGPACRVGPLRNLCASDDLPEGLDVAREVAVLHHKDKVPKGDVSAHLGVHGHPPSSDGRAMLRSEHLPELRQGLNAGFRNCRVLFLRRQRVAFLGLLTLPLQVLLPEGLPRHRGRRDRRLRHPDERLLTPLLLPGAGRVEVPDRNLLLPGRGLQTPPELLRAEPVAELLASLCQQLLVDCFIGVLAKS